MASRKNKWRRRGRLEFRRETKRYHDGTPWGHDILYVRIHRKGCVIVEPFKLDNPVSDWPPLSVLCGTYRLGKAGEVAHLAREYLNYRAAES